MNDDGRRPDLPTLAAWVTGRLDQDQAAAVSAAHDRDASVRADAAWLGQVLAVADALPLVTPPPILRQGLRQQFRRRARGAGAGSGPISLVGVPIYDGRDSPALAGVRAQQPEGEVFQLAWRTELADLLLDVGRTGERFRLDGQVLLGHSTSSPVFEATVHGGSFMVRSVDGDADGRFAIADVPDCAQRLALTNGELLILVELDLAGRAAVPEHGLPTSTGGIDHP